MPVFPCFDPSTGASGGASGGGGGGGADLSGPTITIDNPEVVDLTTGWTLYDPDNVVDTGFGTNGVTFDSGTGITTVKFLAKSGDAKYMPATPSGGHEWPRWYRAINATNLNTVVMSVDLKNDPSVPSWDRAVVVGIATVPTSTVQTTIDGTGAFFRQAGVSAPNYGVWMLGAQTSGSNLSQVRGVSTILRSSDSLGSGAYVTVKADELAQLSGSRNSGFNAGNSGVSAPVFQICGFGTYATGAIPGGAVTAMRITQSTSILTGFGA
jgi:hypothetical protein